MTQGSIRDLCDVKSFIATHFRDKNIPSRCETTDGGFGGHELDGDPGVVGGHEVGVLPGGRVQRAWGLVQVAFKVLRYD